ncbi:GAF domain-containing sensor histidine kinase [Streptomyces sp. NBC_00879]|uniref:sensor histidine kinase n=1 Tax=unclassified Streptomyces TaxID=2593676 RepID=UPI00386E7F12|nr:GAF domain-containing sensor histidine kinase [Streptomyces sp. NBC_00885]WSY78821.1 GAF domain-containing sensor histidine kinase [Streptomyces sp. NBC_00879]
MGGDGTAARMPQLHLDELLDELQARIEAVRGTRDRVHSLLESVLSVGRSLDLTQALHRIVGAAATLVDAQYAALGVIGNDGETLSHFLTVGISEEEIAEIGSYPTGMGVLGELIHRPEALRLSDLSAHSSSHGFPPNHPPMRSFVGVPIRVREEVFGNLYLCDKRGGLDFDAEDETVLSTLAVAAGVAIDNARLYDEAQRQHNWLRASAEITRSLLSGSPREQALTLIAERAKEIAGASLADVSVPSSEGRLTVEVALGEDAPARLGLVVPVQGTLSGAAFTEGSPVACADLAGDARFGTGPRRFDGLGPAVAVPLGDASGSSRGVLLLARSAGGQAFTDQEIGPLLSFADQAALALELAVRRTDAEQLALLEDRDRIARDLHDLAIQRLFATGMTLQSAARMIQQEAPAERVVRAVDDLDETIRIIRSTIFGLRVREETGPSLRARVSEAVGQAHGTLGFAPRLIMDGLLDTDVPHGLAEDVVAVLGEALSNAARHARATRVEVSLRATGSEVVLEVSDNGVGIPEGGRRSGLLNLAVRAEKAGGTFTVTAPQGGGTLLGWTAPLTECPTAQS